MSQAARVEKFEKITPGRPPGQPLPCKSPYGAPRAKNLGWYVSILGFWPKTIRFHMVRHKKATTTLWFAKKTQVESVFFLIWGHLGSFYGRTNPDFLPWVPHKGFCRVKADPGGDPV